jgi:sulfite exporter TauE/SafE
LITFLTAGVAAGAVGGWVTTGGDWLGWQQTAARLAGSAMIGLGVWKALHWWRPVVPGAATRSPIGVANLGWGQRLSLAVSRRLATLRPGIVRLPGHWRAVAIGMVTTLLPCGWLYLFVLVAAATASVAPAMMVMTAFWIGTLPALTALVAGAVGASPRFRPAMPILAAAVLVVTGMYTASGRASTDLMPLGDAARRYAADGDDASAGGGSATGESTPSRFGSSVMRVLYGLSDEPLPCCEPTDSDELIDSAASDDSADATNRRREAAGR